MYVWKKHNGEVPSGLQVHHKDLDKENNEPDNLVVVPMLNHLQYHSTKDAIDNYEEKKERFIRYALPKAIEWHKSKEGRAWHSEHGVEVSKGIKERPPKIITCEVCGKQRETYYQGETKYCSKKCKAKALRARFKEEGRDYEYGRTYATRKNKVD